MCGIAGFIGHRQISSETLNATLASMRNRGPDAHAVSHCESEGLHVYLLHSRLAIIDLDPRSNQPFELDHAVLAFNGEIYNYIELRQQLLAKGIQFRTESDTEVLAASYLLKGEECVSDFEGMWAFALFDKRRRELMLSRDRFGEKPLFYLRTRDGIYFGSEVKFIRALFASRLEPNRRQVTRYLVNGYRSLNKAEDTYWRDVERIPASTITTIHADLSMKHRKYWALEYKPVEMSESKAIEGIREHLYQSLRLRLRSDVPLAFCLSGGVDSAAIASLASKELGCDVACYSIIDSDERYNEADNMKATVDDLHCRWFPTEIRREKDFDRLRELVRYHDAPVATLSYYVHSFLSEAISNHQRKVAFSGTSADELFTGYYDHYLFHLVEMRGHPDCQARLDEWKRYVLPKTRNPRLQNPDCFLNDPNYREHIYLDSHEFSAFLLEPFEEQFTEKRYSPAPLRNRMLNELFHEATPVILSQDDLNSMKYSIENRSPFLDSRLAEFAFTIPTQLLIRDGYGKYLLRQAMRGVLNDKVRLDRQKKGFNAAIESVFDMPHSRFRENLLDGGPIFEMVDRAKVEKLIQQEETFSNSFSKFIFSLISAKLFLESAI